MNVSEMTVREYAEYRRDNAIKDGEDPWVVQFWNGYMEGALAQMEEINGCKRW